MNATDPQVLRELEDIDRQITAFEDIEESVNSAKTAKDWCEAVLAFTHNVSRNIIENRTVSLRHKVERLNRLEDSLGGISSMLRDGKRQSLTDQVACIPNSNKIQSMRPLEPE